MSLLLDALKKAEARQSDAKAQTGADVAALQQETRLELEALEQPKGSTPSTTSTRGSNPAGTGSIGATQRQHPKHHQHTRQCWQRGQ